MTDIEFRLSRDQRDEILRAVEAITRQLKTPGAPRWQSLWVIGTNLSIIQVNVSNLPHATLG